MVSCPGCRLKSLADDGDKPPGSRITLLPKQVVQMQRTKANKVHRRGES